MARDHASPDRVRSELDRLATQLPERLADALASWLCAGEAGVVLIDELVFDCEVDLGGDSDVAIERWAHSFARALVRVLEAGDGLRRFPSAAAYRARFIADLAAGRAWDSWWYRPFAGLKALPTAASQIRTALLEDPVIGRASLAGLPADAWSALDAALSESEAARIVEGLSEAFDSGGTASEGDDLARWTSLVRQVLRERAAWSTAGAFALCVISAGLRADQRATTSFVAWAQLAGEIVVLSGRMDRRDLARAVLSGDDATIERSVFRDGAWRELSRRRDWRSALAGIVAREAATEAVGLDRRGTACAGLALLLRELDELLDATVCAALPASTGVLARNLAGWVGLAHAAGACRAGYVLSESLWRDIFSIPPSIGLPDMRSWLASDDARSALEALGTRVEKLARGRRVLAPLRVDVEHHWLSVDEATGMWCAWEPSGPETPASFGETLASARRARADWIYSCVDWGLPAAWRRFFVQLAQAALRRFAFRVPGFAKSSFPYLYANFLSSSGESLEGSCLVLTKPPLWSLLNLTGVARSPATWSGPPPRTLELCLKR